MFLLESFSIMDKFCVLATFLRICTKHIQRLMSVECSFFLLFLDESKWHKNQNALYFMALWQSKFQPNLRDVQFPQRPTNDVAVPSVFHRRCGKKTLFFFLFSFSFLPIQKNLCAAASPIARIKSDPSRNALVLLPPVAVYDFFFVERAAVASDRRWSRAGSDYGGQND